MTKTELIKLIRELNSAVKDLKDAVVANDYKYASACMEDVDGVGAQIREELEKRVMIYEMYCMGCDETFIGDSPDDIIHTACGRVGTPTRTIDLKEN